MMETSRMSLEKYIFEDGNINHIEIVRCKMEGVMKRNSRKIQ